jgi:rubrerythrin
MPTDRILATSARLRVDDLDWELARRAGLGADERVVLSYFADIESQTVMYLRDLLRGPLAEDPRAIGFLSVWNYEEYFHGEALSSLLEACGAGLARDRVARVRRGAAFLETLQGLLAGVAARLAPDAFAALHLAWGASQELTTLRGYEELEARTANPVLAELCRRIAKQERRHFAWYFNGARERLAESPLARRLARLALSRAWAPVGAPVKGTAAFLEVARALFPGRRAAEIARDVEERIGTLPGLHGLPFFTRFLRRAGAVSPGPDAARTGLAAIGGCAP